MTKPHRRILLGLLAMLWLAPAAQLAAQQPAPALLTGNDQGNFLLVPTGAARFTVLVRPANKDWLKVASDIDGAAVFAQAVGGNCYVAFQGGNFAVCDGSGDFSPIVTPPAAEWPRDSRLLAMAAYKPSDDKQPILLALVAIAHGSATRPSSQPATAGSGLEAAASRPATTRIASGELDLEIFQYTGQWSRWASLGRQPWHADDKAFMASHNGKVWLLVSGPRRPNRLLSTDGKTTQPVDLEGRLADWEAAGLVATSNALAAVLAGPVQQGNRTLELAVLEDGAKPSYEPVKLDGRAYQWPASSLPSAAAMLGQLNFAWRQDSKLMWSPCGLDGKMAQPRDLQDVVKSAPAQGEIFYNRYYLMAVFIAIMLFMFFLRPRGSDVPFALPPEVVPGKLIKRVVAAAIDFLPFLIVSVVAFQVPQLSSDEAMLILEGKAPSPDSLWYASMAATTGFAIYGLIMEGLLGATLGKLAMGLRVCGNGGGPADWRAIVVRNLMKIMELSWPLAWPLLLLFPVLGRNRQRLGDLMARTAVIDKRRLELPPPPADEQNASAGRDRDDRDEM